MIRYRPETLNMVTPVFHGSPRKSDAACDAIRYMPEPLSAAAPVLPRKARGSDDFVELVIRHSVRLDGEVRLLLPRDACFADVKRILSMGDEAFLRKALFVKEIKESRQGSILHSYRDEDPVGDVHEIFLFGTELPTLNDSEDAEEDSDRDDRDLAGASRRLVTYCSKPLPGPTIHELQPPEESEVEVSIHHAAEGTEVTVKVPHTARLSQVRWALAAKLGRKDLLSRGKLLRKKGKLMFMCRDDEKLDATRNLEIVDVPLEHPVQNDLTTSRVRQVLRKFRVACERSDFQETAASMSSRMLGMLLLGVWKKVAGELGLDGDTAMFEQMLAEVRSRGDDAEVRELIKGLEQYLQITPGGLFGVPAAEPMLSCGRTRDLLEEYAAVCAQPSNLEAVRSLRRWGGVPAHIGLTELMVQVTAEVAERLAFGRGWTFEKTLLAISEHGAETEVQGKVRVLEKLIGADTGALCRVPDDATAAVSAFREWETPAPNPRMPPRQAPLSEDVQVHIRHGTSGGEVFLTASSDDTMLEVRESLAECLNCPDILRNGQFVRRIGTVGSWFVPYSDQERLDGRHELLFIGPRLQDAEASGWEIKEESEESCSSPQSRGRSLSGGFSGGSSPTLAAAAAPAVPGAALSGGPKISKAEVLALQQDLKAGFVEQAFQERLQEIEQQHQGKDTAQYRHDRMQLFLTVQSHVLPTYGFDGDYSGVISMMAVLLKTPELNNDPDIQRNLREIDALLGVPHSQPPLPTVRRKSAPKKVWVKVRHAVGRKADEGAQVRVSAGATMREVREAIAEQLGMPEVLTRGRLVQRIGDGTAFQSFKDGEILGDRRTLRLLGVEDVRPTTRQVAGPPEQAVPPVRRPVAAAAATDPPSRPTLTLAQAVALQRDLILGFSKEDFQGRLEQIRGTLLKTDEKAFIVERQQLFLSVQSRLLPNYGIPGSMRGVCEMLAEFERPELHANDEVQRNKAIIDQLLFGDKAHERQIAAPGPEKPLPAAEALPEHVEVRVRRYTEDSGAKEDIHVYVSQNATMREVKAALALKLNNNDVLYQGNFVRKQQGVVFKYDDSEPLGRRRRLLFYGVDFKRGEKRAPS